MDGRLSVEKGIQAVPSRPIASDPPRSSLGFFPHKKQESLTLGTMLMPIIEGKSHLRRLVPIGLHSFLTMTLMILLGGGCASYTEEIQDMRIAYSNANYSKALEKLEQSPLKGQSKNRLLYHLEKGLIYDRLGDAAAARKSLFEAANAAEELFTTSVTSTAASFVVSETSTDYDGEDYEKVAIHTMLALSFLETGDLRKARVEAKQIITQLHAINSKYDEKTKNRYADDAFALTLSGLTFEALGEWNDAGIDYRRALSLYESYYDSFHQGGVPEGLVQAVYRVSKLRKDKATLQTLEKRYANIIHGIEKKEGAGYLVVIHELGQVAPKIAKRHLIPVGRQVLNITFPVMHRHTMSTYGRTGIEIGKNHWVPAENYQDMTAIAHFSLEDRRLRMVAKQTARLIAKGAATEAAHENFGALGGLAVNLLAAATETADTRSWTSLPDGMSISRVELPPGKHAVQIFHDGRLADTQSVEIESGKIHIFRVKGGR